VVLRGIAPRMQQILGQPLVIENKAGANGNIGAVEAARSAPDGYTWFWSTDTTLTVNPHVYEKMPFRLDDLQPVMRATAFSQTLVCNPAVGVRTVAELVRKARATPLTYASGGPGSPGHLSTELFSTAAGITMTHVPYKGPAPAMQDMLGGQVECGFLAGPTVLPHVKAGRLVALAVSGAHRSPLLPDVPTVAEAGYPGYDATFSLVLFAPRGTPAAITRRMHDAMATALRDSAMTERLLQSDQSIVAGDAAEASARLAQDSQRWGAVARRIQLKLD
jgi:tripartite-type tricarboxylate transporter receptor subunit TctC